MPLVGRVSDLDLLDEGDLEREDIARQRREEEEEIAAALMEESDPESDLDEDKAIRTLIAGFRGGRGGSSSIIPGGGAKSAGSGSGSGSNISGFHVSSTLDPNGGNTGGKKRITKKNKDKNPIIDRPGPQGTWLERARQSKPQIPSPSTFIIPYPAAEEVDSNKGAMTIMMGTSDGLVESGNGDANENGSRDVLTLGRQLYERSSIVTTRSYQNREDEEFVPEEDTDSELEDDTTTKPKPAAALHSTS